MYGFRGKAYKARTEEEMSRLGERLRRSPSVCFGARDQNQFKSVLFQNSGAAADSELQLRQELQQSEQSRQELQARKDLKDEHVFVLSAVRSTEHLLGDIAPERNEWSSFQAGIVASRVNDLSHCG